MSYGGAPPVRLRSASGGNKPHCPVPLPRATPRSPQSLIALVGPLLNAGVPRGLGARAESWARDTQIATKRYCTSRRAWGDRTRVRKATCRTTTSTAPRNGNREFHPAAAGSVALVGGPRRGCTWSTHQGMVKRPHAERLRQPRIRRDGRWVLIAPCSAFCPSRVACFSRTGVLARPSWGTKADSGSTTRRVSVGCPAAGLR
jgi:hypothetical protein